MKCGICLQDVDPIKSPAGASVCPNDGEASWLDDAPASPSPPKPAAKKRGKTNAADDAADNQGN